MSYKTQNEQIGTFSTSSCTKDEKMNEETINYRLTAIESTLSEMKDLLVQYKLQQEKIVQLDSKQKETDDRLDYIASRLDEVNCKINDLQMKPVQASAKRWQHILDYGFKLIVGAAFAGLMVKLGVSID